MKKVIDFVDENGLGIFVFILIALLLVLVGFCIQHEIKYKCVRGHYEDQWVYNPALKMSTYQSVYVCDEEVLRDSIK